MLTDCDEAWLKLTIEEPIDPGLPICDPHHHLWDRPNNRYLLPELLRDTGGGHHIVRTVFMECRSMYKSDEPEAMRPVGETEFVQSITKQSAAENQGTKVAAGIVGFADLRLGAAIAPVLEAHMAASDRFRGIRHISVWQENQDAPYPASAPTTADGPEVPGGFRPLARIWLELRCLAISHAIAGTVRPGQSFPGHPYHIESYRDPARRRSLCREAPASVPAMEERHCGTGILP